VCAVAGCLRPVRRGGARPGALQAGEAGAAGRARDLGRLTAGGGGLRPVHLPRRRVVTPPEHDPDEGSGESVGLPITLIVSPANGRLRVLPPVRFRGGREWVEAGQPVGRVEHGGSTADILAPV